MGQKTNPIGNRLGYIHGWESNWYGGRDYKDKIVEDDQIRKYLKRVSHFVGQLKWRLQERCV